MPVIPNTIVQQIEFFEQHVPVWNTADPTVIGLQPEQVAEIQARTTAARNAYEAALAARQSSRNATVAMHDAVRSMREYGGGLVNTIKAYAQATGNENVYTLAEIPPPNPPSPTPAPNQPYDVRWSITTTGNLHMTWKASGNFATYYEVFRQLPGETSFRLLGTAGDKAFTDSTIPAGTPSAVYYIRPRRDEKTGPASNQVTVAFNPAQQESGGELSLAA